MRKAWPLIPILLMLAMALPPLAHTSTIIDHEVLKGDYGHMDVFVYVHQDADSDPDEDFYAFQIRIHARAIPGLLLTDLLIWSPQGTCDRWEPTAGKKGGSLGFSYGESISFSVTIPQAWIRFWGANTHEIAWRVSPTETGWDMDFGAGFYVPEGSAFTWRIEVTVLCYTIITPAIVTLWESRARWNPSGDANCDGHVRVDDILLTASAFGSEPGHPRWNPSGDVTGDGKVRADDILLVACRFGADYS